MPLRTVQLIKWDFFSGWNHREIVKSIKKKAFLKTNVCMPAGLSLRLPQPLFWDLLVFPANGSNTKQTEAVRELEFYRQKIWKATTKEKCPKRQGRWRFRATWWSHTQTSIGFQKTLKLIFVSTCQPKNNLANSLSNLGRNCLKNQFRITRVWPYLFPLGLTRDTTDSLSTKS